MSDAASDEAAPPGGETRCGLVTILGRTNVGKSTLLNQLVGAKVSIITERRQTTRRNVHGVLTEGAAQAVFVDTPGLHRPEDPEGQRLLREAKTALEDVDLVLAVVVPGDRVEGGTRHLVDWLRLAGKPPALLVVNKVDTVDVGTPHVRRTVEALSQAYPFERVFPVSARTGLGLELLTAEVLGRLPAGPFLYPPEEVSNVPQPFYVAEIVREKAMELTEEEVPHSLDVEVTKLRRDADDVGTYRIEAAIFVDRESRKAILIGARGSKVRAIRKRAEAELAELTGAPVSLKVHIELRRDWRKGKHAKKRRKRKHKRQRSRRREQERRDAE